jgi:deoxyadenosine/deoxycytidine kinase
MTVDIFMIVVNDRDDYLATQIELFLNWFEAWTRFNELLVEYGMLDKFNQDNMHVNEVTNILNHHVCNGDISISLDAKRISIT